MRKKLAVLAALAMLAVPAFARTRVVRQISSPWLQPQCAQISGMPWVRFIDADNHVHVADPALEVVGFRQYGPEPNAIAAAAAANVLFATLTDGSIYQSSDSGCSWQLRARVPEALGDLQEEPHILADHLGRVYIHTLTKMVRLTHATVETFPFVEPALHVDVDPKNQNHLRAIAKYGGVFESYDGAASWTRIGSLGVFTLVSAAATDPKDFAHVLATTAAGSLLTSENGGKTWSSRGLDRAISHDIAFSPADSSVVWMDAYDGVQGTAGLYVSNDGGRTFKIVDVSRTRGEFTYGTLAPHPTNAALVGLTPGLGTAVYTPDGLQTRIYADNVRQVIWSPSGTLYYLVSVIHTL